MRLILAFLALVAAPALLSAAPAAPDWTKRVTVSPTGAYVMGNPAAATKLVEYISYTCVHCAHFVNDNGGALKLGWVRGGRVSVEVRNAVRDRYDLTAAILARCGGPAKFFDNHVALFGNYDAWMQRVQTYENGSADPSKQDQGKVMIDIADKTGLFALLARRGFTRPQLVACLSDKAAREKVVAMADDAWNKRKIGGTPAFLVNDRLLDEAHDWDGLKAALPPAAS